MLKSILRYRPEGITLQGSPQLVANTLCFPQSSSSIFYPKLVSFSSLSFDLYRLLVKFSTTYQLQAIVFYKLFQALFVKDLSSWFSP